MHALHLFRADALTELQQPREVLMVVGTLAEQIPESLHDAERRQVGLRLVGGRSHQIDQFVDRYVMPCWLELTIVRDLDPLNETREEVEPFGAFVHDE